MAEANWGISVIEDRETGEVSLQCICGQVGLYPRRAVLTKEEVEAFRQGHLDIDQAVSDICKETDRFANRLVPPISLDQL
ncbi:MAG TPA: hypothetical protein VNN80_03230 [Polyangiaceae bacterium]|nr:hypothetical protein [Polyangiaceae bacterium]